MRSYIKVAVCILAIACTASHAEDKAKPPAAEQAKAACGQAQVQNVGQVFYDEILIDKPVAEVWPQILNYAKWQLGHLDAEHTTVKGEHNKVGEIVRILKTQKDAKPYYAETVRLRPNRNVVWRIFGSQTEPCGDAFGTKAFLDFRTEDVDGKTLFTANYYALWPPYGQELSKLRAVQQQGKEGVDFLKDGGVAFKKYMEGLGKK